MVVVAVMAAFLYGRNDPLQYGGEGVTAKRQSNSRGGRKANGLQDTAQTRANEGRGEAARF